MTMEMCWKTSSIYLERIIERRISVRPQVGTSTFTIDSIPRDGDVHVSMVNEGFGVNQLAYMLTVCLYSKYKIVAIEEPEIHLHPSMVRNLVHAMADIASKHGKRFVVSTHSEVFVVSLLAQIAAGEVSVDDVSFILAEKEDGESRFTRQEAKPNGQIEGGLDSFVASPVRGPHGSWAWTPKSPALANDPCPERMGLSRSAW